jgi:hypothetical protein
MSQQPSDSHTNPVAWARLTTPTRNPEAPAGRMPSAAEGCG